MKKWYLSKGVWGSIIVVAAIVLRLVGQETPAAVIEEESAAISDWILEAVGMVGALLAFVGRITAKDQVTL